MTNDVRSERIIAGGRALFFLRIAINLSVLWTSLVILISLLCFPLIFIDLPALWQLPEGSVGSLKAGSLLSLPEDEQLPAAFFTVLFMIILALWLVALLKLRAIVRSVIDENPFTDVNVKRLRWIGWIMVIAYLIAHLVIYLIPLAEFSTNALTADSDVSWSYIIPMLFVFVLAEVFNQGVAMREELEGTI